MEKNIYNKIVTFGFSAFIGGFLLVNIITPDTEFSENENRFLQELPEFEFEEFLEGEFTADFETYITDQFVFRDNFVELKSTTELWLGKSEFNGIYLGFNPFMQSGSFIDENLMLERFEITNEERLVKNAQAVETFAQNMDIPVYLSIIPTSTHVYKNYLPENAPNDDQQAVYDNILGYLGTAKAVDLFSVFENKASEYVYYRTDHHWTTLGAYYGYLELADMMGFAPVDIENYTESVVSNEFNGTYYSTSGIREIPSDEISMYVPQGDIEMLVMDSGQPVEGSFYDDTFLDKKDKYSYFLGGNQALNVFKNPNGEGKLLLIRDSYSNAQVQFLAQNYEEIHMIDMRYMKQNLKEYAELNDIDSVLVQYNMSNFATDTNIVLLGNYN